VAVRAVESSEGVKKKAADWATFLVVDATNAVAVFNRDSRSAQTGTGSPSHPSPAL
jgi:hypothetical protein